MSDEPKQKAGRPRKLDDSTKDQVLAVLTDGGSRSLAAAIVGCHITTIANEAANDPEFLEGLKRAEADCELYHIRRIREGKQAWQSSAWFLERKFSKRWSKKEPKGAGDGYNRDELLRMAAAMVSAANPPGAGPTPR